MRGLVGSTLSVPEVVSKTWQLWCAFTRCNELEVDMRGVAGGRVVKAFNW